MKAARFYGARDVRIEDVAEPVAPTPDEVVLDVVLASVCGTDSSEWAHGPLLVPLRARHPVSGHIGPLVLGHEFVGRVARVGSAVSEFVVGDRVVSGAGVSCGQCDWCQAGRTNLCARYYTIGFHVDGGLAQQVKTPARICRRVPDTIDDRAATLSQPLAVALHAINRSGIGAGQTCAVIGAGGIGAFILAGVAARSVEKLIAVDVDAERLNTARRLGATHTIDARHTEPGAAILDLTSSNGAHVVFEASGAPPSPAAALRAARRGGRVVLVGLHAAPRELDLLAFTVREVDIITTLAHVCQTDLPSALNLLANPVLADTVIDRVIPLDALVDGALQPLAAGRARGKIIVDPWL